MNKAIQIEKFLELPGTIIDVRSPAEYQHSNLPESVSIPLFSNEERVEIGTLYKQVGQEEAIDLGLKIVGPKLSEIISEARDLCQGHPLKIYCWRGGMRSNFLAQTLNLIGIPSLVLQGGYKSFRRLALETISKEWSLKTLGGLSGSDKTGMLYSLQEKGEQMLDLEGLANHRGSSFGGIGKPPQPSVEAFENRLAYNLLQLDPEKPIWVEDESRLIGCCKVPDSFYKNMQTSPLYILNIPREERLETLVKVYGSLDCEKLVEATTRLQKQLGGERTKQVCEYFRQNNPHAAIDLVLGYYDKAYSYSIEKRQAQLQTFDKLTD